MFMLTNLSPCFQLLILLVAVKFDYFCLQWDSYYNWNISMLKILKTWNSPLIRQIKTMADKPGPVETSIRNKMTAELSPSHLEVINESYMHNVPKDVEMHFKVVVVSKEFEGIPLIQRHRRVNKILDEELKNGLHALSIVAKTPEQWAAGSEVSKSPPCLGGFGK